MGPRTARSRLQGKTLSRRQYCCISLERNQRLRPAPDRLFGFNPGQTCSLGCAFHRIFDDTLQLPGRCADRIQGQLDEALAHLTLRASFRRCCSAVKAASTNDNATAGVALSPWSEINLYRPTIRRISDGTVEAAALPGRTPRRPDSADPAFPVRANAGVWRSK